jgi:NADPH:quinone reductase-like Zn-dependent oxidoreductase
MQAGKVAEPAVDDRDVLVDIHAAGVNLLDAKIRDGEFKLFRPHKAPFILGHDLAGVGNASPHSPLRHTAPAAAIRPERGEN